MRKPTTKTRFLVRAVGSYDLFYRRRGGIVGSIVTLPDPTAISWRERGFVGGWIKFITPVKNFAECGTEWYFAYIKLERLA